MKHFLAFKNVAFFWRIWIPFVYGLLLAAIPKALAAEMEFAFRFSRPTNGLGVEFRTQLSGATNALPGLAEKYETAPSSLGVEEKRDVFRWYCATLRFIEAERVAEELALKDRDDGNGFLSLGVSRLFRGDYERACEALELAANRGNKRAAYLHLYVAAFLLGKSEALKEIAEGIVRDWEANQAPDAAYAVLAFCLNYRDPLLFAMFADKIAPSLLSSDSTLRAFYLKTAKELGNEKQVERIRQLPLH